MRDFSLSHLTDAVLLQNLSELVHRDRAITADLLAHIAEVDARRLYDEAGYSSMFAYCTKKLRLSEDAAWKRIYGARAARKFPALLGALDLGKIHLTGLCLVARHATPGNVEELIEGATHKGKSEIETWLVANSMAPAVPIQECTIKPIVVRKSEDVAEPDDLSIFPSPDTSTSVTAQGQAHEDIEVSSNRALPPVPERANVSPEIAPRLEHAPTPRPSTAAPAPEHYRMQVTIGSGTHDKLRRAQALLGHAVPLGDVAEVLDRALDLLITHLEKRKFGAKAAPRGRNFPTRESPSARYVPMQVRRAVWARDQGRCTFVSAGGVRCGEQTRLEYDHIRPVARGGSPTEGNVRLRCRAHNQCEARRAFGSEFMRRKRS